MSGFGFGFWSSRRMTYFVPLMPRYGVPFHMTPNDIKLTNTPFRSRKLIYKQAELLNLNGKQIISDDDFPYFVAGWLVRTVINTFITYDVIATGMTLGVVACNEPLNNTMRIHALRKELDAAYSALTDAPRIPKKK